MKILNNLDVPEGQFCYNMIRKACKLQDDWYDWSEEQLQEFLDKNSGNGYAFVEYFYYELGRDEKWFKKQVREMEGDMAKVKREILIEWTYASSFSIFTEEQLDLMSQHIHKENVNTIYINGYKIDVVEQFNNLMYKNWVLSVDIGGGLGADYSAFTLIDPMSYKTVMKFKNNMISVLDFADLIIKFVQTYVPNAILIPERNNSGIVFIEAIQKTSVGKNLYYTSTEDKQALYKIIEKKSIFNKSTKKTKKEKLTYGFDTTTATRKVMTEEILFMMATSRPDLVNNQELFDEMRKLIREKSGKINHMLSEHDDLTMSYLIGLFFLIYAPNKNRFLKNISNEPVNEETKKEVSKEVKKFKEVASYNNEIVMNTKIIQNSIDPDLIEMQRLIDEKNSKKPSGRARNIKNIFNLNKM